MGRCVTEDEPAAEGDDPNISSPLPVDIGIPTPWIDPFPRPRDPEWEDWWVAKEPRGA